MAAPSLPRHVSLYQQAKELAMGHGPLAKFVPPALLALDAVLCSLIISRIPCMSSWEESAPIALLH